MEKCNVLVNPLVPGDAIWQQRTWATQVLVMTCSHQATSPCGNQSWRIIIDVLWMIDIYINISMIGWDNGLSLGWHQAIISTNAFGSEEANLAELLSTPQQHWRCQPESVVFIWLTITSGMSTLSLESWTQVKATSPFIELKKMWEIECPCHRSTHLGRDKMTAIYQTFSNAFSWIKMYKVPFHGSLFPFR